MRVFFSLHFTLNEYKKKYRPKLCIYIYTTYSLFTHRYYVYIGIFALPNETVSFFEWVCVHWMYVRAFVIVTTFFSSSYVFMTLNWKDSRKWNGKKFTEKRAKKEWKKKNHIINKMNETTKFTMFQCSVVFFIYLHFFQIIAIVFFFSLCLIFVIQCVLHFHSLPPPALSTISFDRFA